MYYKEYYKNYMILQNSIEDKETFEIWEMINHEYITEVTTVEEAKRRIEEHKEQRGY